MTLSKRTYLATTALSLSLASTAFAADLPARKGAPEPFYAAPVFTWTGFYVGANLGGVWSSSSYTEIGPVTIGFLGNTNKVSSAGVIGGIQAGYNWQTSNFVLGVEADIDAASARASTIDPAAFFPLVHTGGLNYLGTVRGRLGWAFDRFLPYVTGGFAYGGVKNNAALTGGFVPPNAGRNSASGWTLGGGLEYAVTNNWTIKAEYLYVRFGDKTAGSTTPGAAYNFRLKDNENVARVGVNYKF